MMTRTPATQQRQKPTSRSGGWNDGLSFDGLDFGSRRPAASNTPTSHTRSCSKAVEDNATPRRNVEELRAWSEAPVSPRQRATLGAKHSDERENWDEDFLDATESPAKPSSSTPLSHSRGIQRDRSYEDPEQENWDEDFELGMNTGSPRAGPNSSRSKKSRRGRQRGPKWETSDDEMDFDREMGFDRNDEEDKTVTSRSRRKPLSSLSTEANPLPALLPLPALPIFLPTIQCSDASGPYASPPSPFPRSSPSHSVFSIPATTTSAGQRDRDSTYGSTAHLALSLRRTHSAESSPSSPLQHRLINPNRFPQGADLPRERRRLRKKSRPPHLDSSIMELDDRAVAEPTFHRPSTPDSRPCTPPSSNSGVGLAPTSPSCSAHSGISPPVPTSPASASKSPLLARIGSIRRWGRKRANTTTAGELVSGGNTQQAMRSPSDTAPPSAFPPKTFNAEADRHDNNRTPRPRPHVVTSDEPPLSTLPILQSQDGRGPPKTPNRNRFFRGSSGGMEANASARARANFGVEAQDLSREKSREGERLRSAIPQTASMAPQSSQSGDSETGLITLPRKHRVRALGHKLLPAKRSVSRGSPERVKDSSDGGSSQLSGIGNKDISTPLTSETPTRLRPRVPSSRSSSRGKTCHVVPRSLSGSAVKERAHSPLAPTMGTSGRSVSASGSMGTAPSSEDLVCSDKGFDEKAGHRVLMGSLRRISLVTAHAQRQQQSADTHSHSRAQSPPIPPLPRTSDEAHSSNKSPTSPNISQQMPSFFKSPAFESIHVDLSSPTSGSPRDWPTSGHRRRSGDAPALTHSKSSSFATSSSPNHGATASRLSSASQVASLGRASPLPTGSGSSANPNANSNVNALRRISLGDLKIPSRISRAQDGLKRDLGRVREFATRVEQMQELRTSYFAIAAQIQNILNSPPPQSRATSPTAGLFGLSRSNSRSRANRNPPALAIDYNGLASGFQAIDAKYSIAWECADLLIELGTGNVSDPTSKRGPGSEGETANRERAVSLTGDERRSNLPETDLSSPRSFPTSSPPPLVSCRSTADRQDLGHRQLYLLKEMLNNAESLKEDGVQLDIPDVPHWATTDEALESTLTLPTDESAVTNPPPGSPLKKRKTSRLVGIRDMLRNLKRSAARAVQIHSETVVQSSTTLSTESSFDAVQVDKHPYGYNTVAGTPSHPVYGRRKSETNAALVESMRSPPDQEYEHFAGSLLLSHKSSPRRPSLASLFRLGQKRGGTTSPSESPNQSVEPPEALPDSSAQSDLQDGRHRPDTSRDDFDDSDWDRMDSMSDVDVQLAAIADGSSGRGSTMKLRKKRQLNRLSMPPTGLVNLKHHIIPYNSSQGSFGLPDRSTTNVRSQRLSNVDENDVNMSSTGSVPLSQRQTPESSRRPRSRVDKGRPGEKQFSSVRMAPPKSNRSLPTSDARQPSLEPAASLKLAMTPENMKPLLENARVVTARLHDCIAEVKGLLIREEGATFSLSSSAASSSSVALP